MIAVPSMKSPEHSQLLPSILAVSSYLSTPLKSIPESNIFFKFLIFIYSLWIDEENALNKWLEDCKNIEEAGIIQFFFFRNNFLILIIIFSI